VPHPADAGVLLGTAAPDGDEFDAVVTLCRLGHSEQWASHVAPSDHVEVWLMDKEDPDRNPNRHFVIEDAARTLAVLRSEGKRVWLHCVAAHNRTPTVAARYGVLCGSKPCVAKHEVGDALRLAWTPTETLWKAVDELGERMPDRRQAPRRTSSCEICLQPTWLSWRARQEAIVSDHRDSPRTGSYSNGQCHGCDTHILMKDGHCSWCEFFSYCNFERWIQPLPEEIRPGPSATRARAG